MPTSMSSASSASFIGLPDRVTPGSGELRALASGRGLPRLPSRRDHRRGGRVAAEEPQGPACGSGSATTRSTTRPSGPAPWPAPTTSTSSATTCSRSLRRVIDAEIERLAGYSHLDKERAAHDCVRRGARRRVHRPGPLPRRHRPVLEGRRRPSPLRVRARGVSASRPSWRARPPPPASDIPTR